VSAELIDRYGDLSSGALLVGAGTSQLPGILLARGARDVAVLDQSPVAVEALLARYGAKVDGIVADITAWVPDRRYGVWQDRAVFHFLTEDRDQEAYILAMRAALAPGGLAVIGTFAEDGPDMCSGLPVRRYSAGALVERFGEGVELVEARRHVHITPKGSEQPFTFVALRRLA
jgi:SAM-dependent methyltransferase